MGLHPTGRLSSSLDRHELSVSLCRTTAALVIVHFTLKLLNRELPTLSDSDSYSTLCGAFIFVCRQMYNTCEGLQVLRPHGLHEAVAAAWKKVHARGYRTEIKYIYMYIREQIREGRRSCLCFDDMQDDI